MIGASFARRPWSTTDVHNCENFMRISMLCVRSHNWSATSADETLSSRALCTRHPKDTLATAMSILYICTMHTTVGHNVHGGARVSIRKLITIFFFRARVVFFAESGHGSHTLTRIHIHALSLLHWQSKSTQKSCPLNIPRYSVVKSDGPSVSTLGSVDHTRIRLGSRMCAHLYVNMYDCMRWHVQCVNVSMFVEENGECPCDTYRVGY